MSTSQKSIKLNLAMNAILTMSNFIFPLITFPYVSRVLLPVGTGKVSFANSLISYFSIFAQLGVPTYGIRACAKVRDDKIKLTKIVHELLIISIFMDIISYAVLAAVLIFIPRLFEDRLLYIVMSSSIFLTSIGVEWLYKALEKYTYITVRSIAFKFISLIAMFLLVHTQDDVVIYGAISILASSASFVFNFINIRKYIYLKPIGKYNVIKHIKPVMVFFAMSCATTIYIHLNTVVLGFMTNDIEVGYFNVAVRIKSILVSIVTSVGTVLLPRSSYNIEHGLLDSFWNISKKAFNFVSIVSVPLTVYFIFWAKECVYFLSGTAYDGSVIPLQFIMPSILFIGLSSVIGNQILVPFGKERTVLYSEVSGAFIDIILCLILIPQFTSIGASIGTVAAEFLVLIVQLYSLKKDAIGLLKNVPFFKISFALILASITSLCVKFLNLDIFISLIISSILFFSVYGLTLLITKEPLTKEAYNGFKSILDTVISHV